MVLIIVIITSLVSILAFSNHQLSEELSMKPTLVYHRFHVHRIFSHSLVHADWAHLIVNMYVLYIFGELCMNNFTLYFGGKSNLYFIQLYLFSLAFSSIFSIIKHKNNPYYVAVGASGAVMAVVFTSIFFDPWSKLWFFGIVPIPGIIFGFIYLIYSIYMGRKGSDNIGHDAHFFGAIFGFIFPVIINYRLFDLFLDKLFMR